MQGEVSRVMFIQFGAKLLAENPPEINPANLIVSAMLCYRSDPQFWNEHLAASLEECGGVEVAQAHVDQVMADWRRAIEKAERELRIKGGRHG